LSQELDAGDKVYITIPESPQKIHGMIVNWNDKNEWIVWVPGQAIKGQPYIKPSMVKVDANQVELRTDEKNRFSGQNVMLKGEP
jgi:hypothetical protein